MCTRSDCAYTLRDADGPARVRASVAADRVGVRTGERVETFIVRRNRADLLIPSRYVPLRVLALWKAKEVNAVQVKTSAEFCFYEHNAWVTRTVGTNFPRGFKVQSSMRTAVVRPGAAAPKPPMYRWLRMLLIEDVPFKDVAMMLGCSGSNRTLHRKGKEMLRRLLEETREFWAS